VGATLLQSPLNFKKNNIATLVLFYFPGFSFYHNIAPNGAEVFIKLIMYYYVLLSIINATLW